MNSFMNSALKFQSPQEVASSLIQCSWAAKNAVRIGALGTPETWGQRDSPRGEFQRLGWVLSALKKTKCHFFQEPQRPKTPT